MGASSFTLPPPCQNILMKTLPWRSASILIIGGWAAGMSALAACGADAPTSAASATPPIVPLASITVSLPSTLDVFALAMARLEFRDAQNRIATSSGFGTVWSTSDSSVATVVGGLVETHLPGSVTITATSNGVSGSVVVQVAWSRAARLLPLVGFTVETADHLRFGPVVNGHSIPVADLAWTSSNPTIVRPDSAGSFTAIAPGRATIVAGFAGLIDSVTVDIIPAAVGFGYFYSGNAVTTDFDYVGDFWVPESGKGYSSAGSVSAIWAPPYESKPDLGWIGSGSTGHGPVLHAVSLDNVPCAAYLAHDATSSVQGGPLVNCWDPRAKAQSVHMEFVAFTPGEFTGTLGVLRPDHAPFATSAGGISESSPTTDSRAYAMPGVSRDSLFWFAAPGANGVSACWITPNELVPREAAVRIVCNSESYGPKDPTFYSVGFGADARHGAAPIGFVQVDSAGVVTRQSVDGLDITTAGSLAHSLDVVVSGARLAQFDRLPAVLVTAIASKPVSCSITEPFRATPTRVNLLVTCVGASGLMLGVMY